MRSALREALCVSGKMEEAGAGAAAAAAVHLYEIACRWEQERTTREEREQLKTVVARLVGYPVRVACDPHEDGVDILVQRADRGSGDIEDILEIQPSGAIGIVIDDDHPLDRRSQRIQEECDDYNAEHGVEIEGGSSDEESEADIS